MPDKGTGRVPHYDPRNENYRVADALARGLLPRDVNIIRKIARAMGLRETRSWRQWMFFNQGAYPACTGYGSATLVAADPVRPKLDKLRALNPMQWYLDNQALDRSEGRNYSEGATTLAAMKVGQKYGYWSTYRWAYTMAEILPVIHDSTPVVVGTNWYESMWDRDSEGIARIKPGSTNAGGHLWCINGYNPRRGLVRYASTWDDGYYFIPVDDLRQLIEDEEGECSVVTETVPAV